MEASWASLADLLGPLGASWGLLEASWRILGASWGFLVAPLGVVLGRLGGVLGSFWGLLGALGQLLEVLEAQKSVQPGNAYFSNGFLHFLKVPEGSWGPPVGLLGHLGGVLGQSWGHLGPSWKPRGTKIAPRCPKKPPRAENLENCRADLAPEIHRRRWFRVTPRDSEARWRVRRGPSLGFLRISFGDSYVYP